MLGFRRKRTNLHEKYDYPVDAFLRYAIRPAGSAASVTL